MSGESIRKPITRGFKRTQASTDTNGTQPFIPNEENKRQKAPSLLFTSPNAGFQSNQLLILAADKATPNSSGDVALPVESVSPPPASFSLSSVNQNNDQPSSAAGSVNMFSASTDLPSGKGNSLGNVSAGTTGAGVQFFLGAQHVSRNAVPSSFPAAAQTFSLSSSSNYLQSRPVSISASSVKSKSSRVSTSNSFPAGTNPISASSVKSKSSRVSTSNSFPAGTNPESEYVRHKVLNSPRFMIMIKIINYNEKHITLKYFEKTNETESQKKNDSSNFFKPVSEKLNEIGYNIDWLYPFVRSSTWQTRIIALFSFHSELEALGFTKKQIIDMANHDGSKKTLSTLISNFNFFMEKKFTTEQIIKIVKHKGGRPTILKIVALYDDFVKKGYTNEDIARIAKNSGSPPTIDAVLEFHDLLIIKFSKDTIVSIASEGINGARRIKRMAGVVDTNNSVGRYDKSKSSTNNTSLSSSSSNSININSFRSPAIGPQALPSAFIIPHSSGGLHQFVIAPSESVSAVSPAVSASSEQQQKTSGQLIATAYVKEFFNKYIVSGLKDATYLFQLNEDTVSILRAINQHKTLFEENLQQFQVPFIKLTAVYELFSQFFQNLNTSTMAENTFRFPSEKSYFQNIITDYKIKVHTHFQGF